MIQQLQIRDHLEIQHMEAFEEIIKDNKGVTSLQDKEVDLGAIEEVNSEGVRPIEVSIDSEAKVKTTKVKV